MESAMGACFPIFMRLMQVQTQAYTCTPAQELRYWLRRRLTAT